MQPLSFAEYYAFCDLDKVDALEQYLMYGGMPLAVMEQDTKQKRKYLQDLHKNVYQKDIVERYKLKDDVVLSALVGRSTSDNTIKAYLDYLEDAFLFQSAKRWNVKGMDVGVVEVDKIINGKRDRGQYEIDFVVNLGTEKVYIQSALNVDTPEKKAQETFSLRNSGDFCRKVVVLDGNQQPWADEDGVVYTGVIPFMLEAKSLEKIL